MMVMNILVKIIMFNYFCYHSNKTQSQEYPEAIKKNAGFFFDKLTFEGLEAPYLL